MNAISTSTQMPVDTIIMMKDTITNTIMMSHAEMTMGVNTNTVMRVSAVETTTVIRSDIIK